MPVLSELSLFCPDCNNELLRSRGGQIKLRTKVLVRDPGGGVRGVCRNCGREQPLPLLVDLAPPVS